MTPTPAAHGAQPVQDTRAESGDVDWVAAERSPQFRDLVRKRRAFVLPATIFFLSWYLGFILLAGYAPDFMGESLYEGLTVGYGLALTQFVMVWVLSWLYVRRSDRVFDPLAERAASHARDAGVGGRRTEPVVAADGSRAPPAPPSSPTSAPDQPPTERRAP